MSKVNEIRPNTLFLEYRQEKGDEEAGIKDPACILKKEAGTEDDLK